MNRSDTSDASDASDDDSSTTETLRNACIEAALAAYEHAAISGLCPEGAWEAAISGIRRADLEALVAPRETRSTPQRVADLMTREVLTLGADEPVTTARDVMRLGRIRHIPIVDERALLCGLVSQRDLLLCVLQPRERLEHSAVVDPETADSASHPTSHPTSHRGPEAVLASLRIAEIMVRQIVTTTPETPVRDAAAEMYRRKFGCLPVVEQGRIVGILTESDFVRAWT